MIDVGVSGYGFCWCRETVYLRIDFWIFFYCSSFSIWLLPDVSFIKRAQMILLSWTKEFYAKSTLSQAACIFYLPMLSKWKARSDSDWHRFRPKVTWTKSDPKSDGFYFLCVYTRSLSIYWKYSVVRNQRFLSTGLISLPC